LPLHKHLENSTCFFPDMRHSESEPSITKYERMVLHHHFLDERSHLVWMYTLIQVHSLAFGNINCRSQCLACGRPSAVGADPAPSLTKSDPYTWDTLAIANTSILSYTMPIIVLGQTLLMWSTSSFSTWHDGIWLRLRGRCGAAVIFFPLLCDLLLLLDDRLLLACLLVRC
jgi:hypothetical protein